MSETTAWILGLAAPIGVAGGVAGAWLASRTFRRAVGSVATIARAVAGGDLRARVRSPRGDEVGHLANAVDAMADRLLLIVRQAEEERNDLRAILDNAAEGVIVLDDEGRIQLINGAARRIFGAPADAAGRPLVEVTRSPRVQEFLDSLKRSAGSQTIDLETPNEDARHVRLTGGQIPDAAGRASRAVLVVSDISGFRRLERARIDFVANASHELKSPLASILGYAETLHDEPECDPETRKQFVETILRNSKRLEELVNDLLRLARLESPGGAFQFEPIDARDVAERAVETHRDEATVRGVGLFYEPPSSPVPLVGDREVLAQCVSNLVGNAIKFTPQGGIVDVSIDEIDGGVRLVVSDTGVGIPSEQLPRIFERFYRADAGRSRDAGGTGLGLAIAKHAAVLHGGRIDVESAPGRGSRFRVFLPHEPPAR